MTLTLRPRIGSGLRHAEARPNGLSWLIASEVASGALGFATAMHLARRLGPGGFATLEWASAVAAWLLVVVRGGVESIVTREAARRPRLIRPLTDLLLGMKGALAIASYGAVLLLAWASKVEVLAVAGLIFASSALATDAAPRALGRLGVVAAAQGLRAIGYALAAWALVAGPGHVARAAWCSAGAEGLATLSLWAWHVRRFGWPRPRFRRRAWVVFARRGMVASVSRFARVSLYGADVLALGWCAGTALGPYAAARRVVFAIVALGLVVPAAVAPSIARAWAEGREAARRIVERTLGGLMLAATPAAIGLACTSWRWMPRLFGDDYRAGGLWLALIAARLPFLLFASSVQTASLACRREGRGLALVLGMLAIATILVPSSALRAGPLGVGLSMLAIEAGGAFAGAWMLGALGIAPDWGSWGRTIGLGAVALVVACWASRQCPLAVECGAGASAYLLALAASRRLWGPTC